MPDLLGALSGKQEGNHRCGTAKTRNATFELFDHALRRKAMRHRDGVAHGLRRRPAVPDDAESVDAEKRSAAVLGVVHALAEAAERPQRQQVPHARAERALQLLSEQLLDRVDEPLADLQRHVAR